jgi:hypothetical protein
LASGEGLLVSGVMMGVSVRGSDRITRQEAREQFRGQFHFYNKLLSWEFRGPMRSILIPSKGNSLNFLRIFTRPHLLKIPPPSASPHWGPNF